MSKHFLFEPGNWLGTGQVTFSFSPDLLYFRTKWSTAQPDDATYQCTQTVEIIGGDRMVNIFVIRLTAENAFDIILQNELLGVFNGTGVVEPNLVAWEFRHPGTLEGFEVYERLQEQEYAMHAEYLASDGSRTMIRGKIWKATEKLEEIEDDE